MASRKGRRPGASLARLVASAAVEAESAGGAVDGVEGDRRRGAEALTVPLSRIRVREGHNPRTRFDEESIREMAETIAAGGILQPLVVERVAGNGAAGDFWLLHGERRLRSLRFLVESGRRSEEEPVPVFMRGGLDEEERLTSALVENLQREELDPLDEAEGFAQLRDRYGRSTAEIAKAVGRSRRHVQFRLQLLTLEEGVRGWLGAVSIEELLASEAPGERRRARREELYLRLVPVPGKVLDVAFRALVAASVGGWPGKGEPRLESPGLACRIAEDLRVEVDEWGPPAEYFEVYSRPELEEVARELGLELSEGVSRDELMERVAGAERVDEYMPPELVFWDGRRGSGDGVSS